MYISVNDGTAVFASHFIRCIPEGVRENLAPFQLEKDGVVVYGNLLEAETKLQELKIPYAVEALNYEIHKPKAQGIKYASRTEAINHLLNNDEPESQVVPNLKKKLADEKVRNDNLEAKLLKFEQRLMKGGL